MKTKRILMSVGFLIVLALCFYKTADILESKAAREEYSAFFESETNFEVIFLGTSHMYNEALPQELWANYGITSYNWGYSNSTPAESYYILKEVVKYTNPKLIVMDLYGLVEYENYNNGKYRTDRIEQQHVQFDAFPFSLNKLEAIKDIFDDYENNSDFLFDFFLYHTRWDDLTEDDFNPVYSTEKGAKYLTGYATYTVEFVSEDEKTEIDSVCSEYIQPIIEFCNENDIELLFVYLPFGSNAKAQKVSNSFYEFAESYGDFDYLNLLYSDIVDYDTDLYTDERHLNYMGAYKVTEALGEYLMQNYMLADCREDDEYLSWWEDYKEYFEYKNDDLKSQNSLYNILMLAYSNEYYIEVYDNGEGLIEDNLFLNNYFDNSKNSIIYNDTTGLTFEDTTYKMTIYIREKADDSDVIAVGIKNSNLDFDVLNLL